MKTILTLLNVAILLSASIGFGSGKFSHNSIDINVESQNYFPKDSEIDKKWTQIKMRITAKEGSILKSILDVKAESICDSKRKFFREAELVFPAEIKREVINETVGHFQLIPESGVTDIRVTYSDIDDGNQILYKKETCDLEVSILALIEGPKGMTTKELLRFSPKLQLLLSSQ